ncbi:hypothetical protein CGT92_13075 [Vibrio metoecus]|uniref:Uncharacterized protein n=1 Tax=Vibrio metoecus TaxID=1481663 RepID=A0A271VVT1_VIBMT|nr:hypothetical protein CGU03_04565 [Vibrio metoecus]PAR25107.1 hypothetical protein CGU02_06275 [Vibrio metoecus]PAR56156.1 hypothetical protein CGT92_13075 [Vibrio metoecus]PAR63399.1 hypothetical protein CGT91_14885 [Vibrio metoecus]
MSALKFNRYVQVARVKLLFERSESSFCMRKRNASQSQIDFTGFTASITCDGKYQLDFDSSS